MTKKFTKNPDIRNIKLMTQEKYEKLKWLLADFYCDNMDNFNKTDIIAFNRISKKVRGMIN
jgi:hypothetical protein